MTLDTPVHLEQSHRNYTDGEYAADILRLLTGVVFMPNVNYDSTALAGKAVEAMLTESMTDSAISRILEDIPEPSSVPRVSPEEERARAAFLSLWLRMKGSVTGPEVQLFFPRDQVYPMYFDKWFTEKGWKATYDQERQTLSLTPRTNIA
jgi:hypothetical protein